MCNTMICKIIHNTGSESTVAQTGASNSNLRVSFLFSLFFFLFSSSCGYFPFRVSFGVSFKVGVWFVFLGLGLV